MKVVSLLTSLALVIFSFAPGFGFAGGGGSSSGGGGGGFSSGGGSYSGGSSSSSDDDPLIAVIFLVIFVVVAIISSQDSKRKIKQKQSKNNSTPEEKWIHEAATHIFEQYQKDWTDFNYDSIATYATPGYAQHASYMLDLLNNLHRINKVSQLKVNYTCLLNHVDSNTKLPANISVEFGFNGLDEVIDTTKQTILYKNQAHGISETWNFIYDGKSLKLSGISQPTESASHLVKSLADFAKANQLYYSPDWGRYALPSRGLIFGGSTMRISDINNHVIGKWGDLLVQLYTYAETPGTPSSYYLVGQINVPKNYLGVIVKSKKFATHHKPDKNYERFELEWPDFNKRYEVYAARRDALPAFELLNPKFMEYLYDKNLPYNLEVVDNVIYIFANVKHITEADYAELLEILKLAYQELKM